ncbi:hypothetical protein ACFWCF_00150 [Rhodococcus sp. NPDC060090]|uniref:hypothetical protein n=1 Tax=Rhodococcus sp. NPDC060090 TaxID=3347056 RepID=UPI003649C945
MSFRTHLCTPYRFTATGTVTARISAIHPNAAATGWCIGHAESAATAVPEPNNSRSAATTELIGFHSAMARTTDGMMGVALLSGWVANFARQESVGVVASRSGGGAGHVASMLAHGDYPHLAALFTGAGPDSPAAPLDNDAAFVAGIDAMLFGIAPPDSQAQPRIPRS